VFKNGGKLMLFASANRVKSRRVDSVREAALTTAEHFNMGFEVVCFRNNCRQIYIYYGNGIDEPVPIYCDEGKMFDVEGICTSLKKMMFVLSFHPRNLALRTMRMQLMGFS